MKAKTSGKHLEPVVIAADNLSHAWGKVFMHAMINSGSAISPLIVRISGFDNKNMPKEDAAIRDALDTFLSSQKRMNSVKVTAFTIFPQSFWVVADGNRKEFYEMCGDAIPRMKRRDSRNRKGVYFERLFQYGRGPHNGNQIEFILANYRKGVRASLMQAVIFDPARDHSTTALLGFPCLQSVSFVPTKNGLIVNAVYPLQYLVERAYGNFLGVAHLGAFAAEGLGLKLASVNIFAGVERLCSGKTTRLAPLRAAVEKALNSGGAAVA